MPARTGTVMLEWYAVGIGTVAALVALLVVLMLRPQRTPRQVLLQPLLLLFVVGPLIDDFGGAINMIVAFGSGGMLIYLLDVVWCALATWVLAWWLARHFDFLMERA